jgi:hypothetical protein
MLQYLEKYGLGKERLIQMALTALLSALLAFLQNLISNISSEPHLQNTPTVAGAIGATISYFTHKKC